MPDPLMLMFLQSSAAIIQTIDNRHPLIQYLGPPLPPIAEVTLAWDGAIDLIVSDPL